MNFIKRACYLAALTAFLAVAVPAHAQLALSYKLEERSPRIEHPDVVVSPCTGLNWVTAIGACGRELFSRVAQNPRPENLAVYESAPAAATSELPDLGRASERARSGTGKDALIANSKAADLLLKVGSKLRGRSSEEGGWEWYRFSDTTYDNYVKSQGHKALGVELLVPFQ